MAAKLPYPWDAETKKPTPGGAPPSGAIRRVASWVVTALGMKTGEAPSRLALPGVQPVLDVYQHGWGIATFPVDLVDHPPGTAATVYRTQSFPLEGGFQGRVLGMHLVSSIAVAGSLVTMTVVGLTGSPGWIYQRVTLVASPDVRDTIELMAGQPLVVPPGFALDISMPVTAAGERVTLNIGWLITAAGFDIL